MDTTEQAAVSDSGPAEGHPRIVVGIDGSDDSDRALSWAFSEAEARGATLDVVRAWSMPYAWAEGFNAMHAEDEQFFAEEARTETDTALERLLDGKPQPAWLSVHIVEGPPAQVLLARAKGASLLVVGSRGKGAMTRVLLGSVSSAVTHHAECPTVIIPPAAPRGA